MPFLKCPNCNQVFHLLISEEQDRWYKNNAPGKKVGDEADLLCFGCWKELKEFEVVRVISNIKRKRHVKVGDYGEILIVLENDNKEIAYEVECVLPDGSTKWMETFGRNELRYEPELNKRKPEQTDSRKRQ